MKIYNPTNVVIKFILKWEYKEGKKRENIPHDEMEKRLVSISDHAYNILLEEINENPTTHTLYMEDYANIVQSLKLDNGARMIKVGILVNASYLGYADLFPKFMARFETELRREYMNRCKEIKIFMSKEYSNPNIQGKQMLTR